VRLKKSFRLASTQKEEISKSSSSIAEELVNEKIKPHSSQKNCFNKMRAYKVKLKSGI